MNKKREYGIDIMRAFAMFLVIMGHVVGNGGILGTADTGSAEHYAALFFCVFSVCSINIFGLISGYVGYGRKFKPVSLLNLWLRIVFWTVIISSIFVLTGKKSIDFEIIKITLLPIISKSYWYMTGYFVVAILSPLINILIDKVDARLIWAVVIIVTIGLTVVINTSGNNAVWLLILYIYGALIKKGELLKEKPVWFGITGYALCIIITFIAAAFHMDGGLSLNRYLWGFFCGKAYGLWPASVTMLIAAISILLIGINIKTNQKDDKYIGFVTPLILSVYLIHVHPLLYKEMGDFMVWIIKYGWGVEIAGILLVTVSIYIICLFLDYWREKLFEAVMRNGISQKKRK